MGFWILEIAWTFGIGSTSHKKKVDDIYPQKNDGGMGEIFHASLLSSSSKKQFIPWKMQRRKINRLEEAEEDCECSTTYVEKSVMKKKYSKASVNAFFGTRKNRINRAEKK